MFAAGDLVVYGGEGVCRVESVGTPDTSGYDKTKTYYTLAPLYRSGQVMTPVDTCVLMRPVMTAQDAAGFLAALPALAAEEPQGQSQRPGTLSRGGHILRLRAHGRHDQICQPPPALGTEARPQGQPAGRALSAPGGGSALRRAGGGAGH